MKRHDWQGWSLKGNTHSVRFGIDGRRRMILGSKKLCPFIKKYNKKLGKIILEVGPFFNALIIPDDFSDKIIFFWENDRHALKSLSEKYRDKRVFPIFCELNKIDGKSLLTLKMETQNCFNKHGMKQSLFDSVIMSQVFNYIDYKLFLMILKDFLKKDSLIFINNVVDYGLPQWFSNKRPKSLTDTLRTLRESGYEILEKRILESPDTTFQKNKRLLVVAKCNDPNLT